MAKYPNEATRDVLRRFVPDIRKDIGKLHQFCRKLQHRRELGVSSNECFSCSGVYGYVITADVLTITDQLMRDKWAGFCGAELTILDLPLVSIIIVM